MRHVLAFALWMSALAALLVAGLAGPAGAQIVDQAQTPNPLGEGIARTLAQQIGAGRANADTPDSSSFLIVRDPFRAIRRGRQLFQRKFTRTEGQGPRLLDGRGDIVTIPGLGAGLADSCALCHGRPRGSAGSGGNVATRPDSRDAPHLFGAGLKEMLADEITADLRQLRDQALAEARARRRAVTTALVSKGLGYGQITARADGTLDTSRVQGVDADLRVRPFGAHGGTISLREFVVGALQAEMGMQVHDRDLATASAGGRVVTPSGMVLDGATDRIEPPFLGAADEGDDGDGVRNEASMSLVDFLEFYLLNYFKPATGEETLTSRRGRKLFDKIGCAVCHVADLPLARDRRVADVETEFDPERGVFNRLFATAVPLHDVIADGRGLASFKPPRLGPFLVRNIYTDFKRHDLGPAFHERGYDGSVRTHLLTAPLWGVGSTGPYGHDGRSINLAEVIRRHGGEAQAARDAFVRLNPLDQAAVVDFLSTLVLFPPDDTASNLNPGNPAAPGFPQSGHGSIALGVLFNDPHDPE